MKIISLSVSISCILFSLGIPLQIMYIIMAVSVGLSSMILYPIGILPETLKSIQSTFAETLHTKWTGDKTVIDLIYNLWALLILIVVDVVGTVFLSWSFYLPTILLGVASAISVQQLILHLRKYYLEDFNLLLEQLEEEKEKDD